MSGVAARLYRPAAVAMPVAAVVGVTAPLLFGATHLAILGLYFAVPMIAAPVVVRLLRSDAGDRTWAAPRVDWRVWSIPFHATVASLVLLLAVTDVRPYAFYAGVALLYLLCFLLITAASTGRAGAAIPLYHLAVVAALVIYSVTLNYDFFVGHGDLTSHLAMVISIVETGRTSLHVPEYESFQPWHVFVASAYQIVGGWLPVHTTAYLLSGGIFAAGVGLVYGISRRILPNRTVGLLSCLVLLGFPLYPFYGMYSIPRSVTSILFLALLLAIVGRPSARMRALSLALLAAIVVYHAATAPYVLAILLGLFVVERAAELRSRIDAGSRIVDVPVLSTAVFVTAAYWLYSAEFIVDRLYGAIVASFFEESPDPGPPTGVVTEPWAELVNYASYGFALFFVLLGLLFWLSRRADAEQAESAPASARSAPETEAERGAVAAAYTRAAAAVDPWASRRVSAFTAVGLMAILLVPIAFPGPSLLLDALAGVNVGRFGQYAVGFVALLGGYGLYEIVDRGGMAALFAILLLVSCFGFAAVSNDFTASDNPIVERPFYTFYLTDQERDSFERIDAAHESSFGADRMTCRYLSAYRGAPCSVVDASEGDAMFDGHDGVVLREGELERRPLQFTQYASEDDIAWEELRERDRVYDSGSVSFYA